MISLTFSDSDKNPKDGKWVFVPKYKSVRSLRAGDSFKYSDGEFVVLVESYATSEQGRDAALCAYIPDEPIKCAFGNTRDFLQSDVYTLLKDLYDNKLIGVDESAFSKTTWIEDLFANMNERDITCYKEKITIMSLEQYCDYFWLLKDKCGNNPWMWTSTVVDGKMTKMFVGGFEYSTPMISIREVAQEANVIPILLLDKTMPI